MGKTVPENDDNLFRAFANAVYNMIDRPVTWFRGETVSLVLYKL